MKVESLDRFVSARVPRARRERTPLSAFFEITPACNLRCHFCYVALDPYRGPYLSTVQACAVIDRLVEAGVLLLTFTGGEVFARRDFLEVYSHAKRAGLLVTIYSNATMVTPAIADALAADPPLRIEVSIYGADADSYEATTGIKGSYARFERGVELLRRTGIPLQIKHPLSTLSSDALASIRAWAAARRLPLLVSTVIENRHGGGQEPSLYRIEPRRVLGLRAEIREAMGLGVERPRVECGAGDTLDGSPERLYRCGAGRTSLFVDALGNASHCIIDREPSFPILELSWAELWARMGEWVDQPLPPDAPCAGCGLRGGCDNCPARSRLATGSPYLRDEYQCDLTHATNGLPLAAERAAAVVRPLGACV